MYVYLLVSDIFRKRICTETDGLINEVHLAKSLINSSQIHVSGRIYRNVTCMDVYRSAHSIHVVLYNPILIQKAFVTYVDMQFNVSALYFGFIDYHMEGHADEHPIM